MPRSKNDLYLYISIRNQTNRIGSISVSPNSHFEFEIVQGGTSRFLSGQDYFIGPAIMPDSVDQASLELSFTVGGIVSIVTVEATRGSQFTSFNSQDNPLTIVIGEGNSVDFYEVPSGVVVNYE